METLPVKSRQQLEHYRGALKLTEQDLTEIIATLWPEAPEVERKKALLICYQYHLNPLLKHIYIIGPFVDKKTGEESWATVPSIKTKRILAGRQRRYSYLDDTPRIMTDAEQKKMHGYVDPDKLWFITKLRDDRGHTASGYGNYPKGKDPYGTDKGNTKENMGMIRSESAALERLNPEPMPFGTSEVVDERYAEAGGVIEGEFHLSETAEGDEKYGGAEAGNTGKAPPTTATGKGEPPPGTALGTAMLGETAVREGQAAAADFSSPKEAKTKIAADARRAPTTTDFDAEWAELESAPHVMIDYPWLKESAKTLRWKLSTIKSYLQAAPFSIKEGSLKQMLADLEGKPEQAQQFVKYVQDRVALTGG